MLFLHSRSKLVYMTYIPNFISVKKEIKRLSYDIACTLSFFGEHIFFSVTRWKIIHTKSNFASTDLDFCPYILVSVMNKSSVKFLILPTSCMIEGRKMYIRQVTKPFFHTLGNILSLALFFFHLYYPSVTNYHVCLLFQT